MITKLIKNIINEEIKHSDGGNVDSKNITFKEKDYIHKTIDQFKQDILSLDTPVIVDNTQIGKMNKKIIDDLLNNYGIHFEFDTEDGIDYFWLSKKQNKKDVENALNYSWQLFYDRIDKNLNEKHKKIIKNFIKEAYIDDKGQLSDLSFDDEEIEYLSKINPKSKNLNIKTISDINYNDTSYARDQLETIAKANGPTKELYIQSFDRFPRLSYYMFINDSIKNEAIKLALKHNKDFNIHAITFEDTLVYFMGRVVNVDFSAMLDTVQFDEEIPISRTDFLSKLFNIAKDKGYNDGLKYLENISKTKNQYYSKYYKI